MWYGKNKSIHTKNVIINIQPLIHTKIHAVLAERVAYFITPTNIGQFSKPGTDLKSAGPNFSKHPLHVQFDQVLAEIFEVKDTWYMISKDYSCWYG